MKKIAILTLNGNNNFGNKLQNYALTTYLKKKKLNVETLWFARKNYFIKELVKSIIPFKKDLKRQIVFKRFNKKFLNIKYVNKKSETIEYDYYITGSDQVWNYTMAEPISDYLLSFVDNKKRISYSASFGIDNIPDYLKDKYSTELKKFKGLSVREDKGEQIAKELTGRKDIEVLIDPTMLLSSTEWDKVAQKPKKNVPKKYILNYFLGNLSESRQKEIEKIAKENECEVINILDKNDPFYLSGPSEFLYLEKNAFLICTDSFHSSVFAILYDRPFVVFDREDKVEKMNSRIDTLLNKFRLENRKYNDKEITKENLEHDYTNAYKILEKERKKSEEFFNKNLD